MAGASADHTACSNAGLDSIVTALKCDDAMFGAGRATSVSWSVSVIVVATGAVMACGWAAGRPVDSMLLLGALFMQSRRQLVPRLLAVLHTFTVGQVLGAVIGLIVAVSAAAAVRVSSRQTNTSKTIKMAPGPPATAADWPPNSGRPLLLPCVTSHTRLFPKLHSFSYPYLVVGVPVGWSGVCGGMISVAAAGDGAAAAKKGWFHVDASDYLERGSGHLGLRGKLDAHLRTAHGVDPTQYPYAYLVTAARFLGYHFNPVSFWYLYDHQRTLAAMILEVNNTFGERRTYFLTPKTAAAAADDGPDDADNPKAVLFRQTWTKDFHVSPFNSRKGSYELIASDPLSPGMQGAGLVSATIILRSSHEHSKVVARLVSERRTVSDGTTPASAAVQVVDPAVLSAWKRARFLAAWWWVGFATFPRIVRQAGLLFFQKRLHVWFRPEPLTTSMGRLADVNEATLETVFRAYLRHLVEGSADDGVGANTSPLAVRYVPCGLPDGEAELMLSPGAQNARQRQAIVAVGPASGDVPDDVRVVEFRVLTPVFYTRFAGYAHDVEALFCELRDSGTVAVMPPDGAALLATRVLARAQLPSTLQVTSAVDFVAFKAIQKLRQRPARIERPTTWPKNVYVSATAAATSSSSPTTVTGDLRGFRLSGMDGFVLAQPDDDGRNLRRAYRSAVLQQFLADRAALGLVPLLHVQWLLVRAVVCWFAAQVLLVVLRHRGLLPAQQGAVSAV